MSNIEINIKVIIDDKDISKAFEFIEKYEELQKMINRAGSKSKVNTKTDFENDKTNKDVNI
jgi:hypothetical protein